MTEEQQAQPQERFTSVTGKTYNSLRELHDAWQQEYLEYILGRKIEDVETSYL